MTFSRIFPVNSRCLLDDIGLDYKDPPDHITLEERLRKTLYYGKLPKHDCPSLPLTELAVDFFQEAAPRQLDKVDTFWASSVSRKACVSPCSLMLSMIYIERLKHKNTDYLQTISSSDLFLISMMVASKYLYDEGVDEEVFNDEWAESGQVEVADVNELERDFLAEIDWNLYVKTDEFRKLLRNIEKRIAQKEGSERGFFTYTDLMVLSGDTRLLEALERILTEICKVILVCAVAYSAAALTIYCSALTLTYVKTIDIRESRACLPAVLPSRHVLLPESAEVSQFQCYSCDIHDLTQPEVPVVQQASLKPVKDDLRGQNILFLTSALQVLTMATDSMVKFAVSISDKLQETDSLFGTPEKHICACGHSNDTDTEPSRNFTGKQSEKDVGENLSSQACRGERRNRKYNCAMLSDKVKFRSEIKLSFADTMGHAVGCLTRIS